jgi:hypothetical protein
MKNPIPYPLKAAKISIEIRPFGFWFIPRWNFKLDLSENARAGGYKIWYARWAWFQISFSRWQ